MGGQRGPSAAPPRAPAAGSPLPPLRAPLPSHLRRQYGDVVQLQAESGGEAELLSLSFPGKGGVQSVGGG